MFKNASMVHRSPQWQCRLECIQCGASDHTFSEGIPGNNCLEEERTFKIVSPALANTNQTLKLHPHLLSYWVGNAAET